MSDEVDVDCNSEAGDNDDDNDDDILTFLSV